MPDTSEYNTCMKQLDILVSYRTQIRPRETWKEVGIGCLGWVTRCKSKECTPYWMLYHLWWRRRRSERFEVRAYHHAGRSGLERSAHSEGRKEKPDQYNFCLAGNKGCVWNFGSVRWNATTWASVPSSLSSRLRLSSSPNPLVQRMKRMDSPTRISPSHHPTSERTF